MGCFGTLSTTASFFDNNDNNKIAAYAFPRAYSWVFDPSLVSHSISPKNLSDGEHEEQQQRPG
jgi:hypothetical protein